MKRLTTTLMAVTAALLLGLGSTAHAVNISGEIAIASNLNTLTDLASTNAVDFNPNIGVVTSANGNFAPVLFSVAALNDITSLTPLTVINPLWSVGGFTFSLAAITSVSQNANFLNVLGNGLVSAAGFDDTPYNWSLTATRSQGAITISATTVNNPVPEPTSLLLLGSGLVGLGIARRKFARG